LDAAEAGDRLLQALKRENEAGRKSDIREWREARKAVHALAEEYMIAMRDYVQFLESVMGDD
jgi:hypothetical protein